MSQRSKTTFEEAMHIALTYDVNSPKDSVVLYSVSFLPTKQNKFDAMEYVKKNNGKLLLDDTKCGKTLIGLGLDDGTSGLSNEEVMNVWKVAAKRFIEQAKGNVMAFVKYADPRSVFRTKELPELLKNPNVIKINGIDKFEFAKLYEN